MFQIKNLLLNPIVIFEGHGNPEAPLAVSNNLPELIKAGYQVVSLEFDVRRNIENVINGLETAVKKADEAIDHLAKIYGVTYTTSASILNQLINQLDDISESQKKIYKAYIIRRAGNLAKLQLLKHMQSAKINFFGVDKENIDESDALTLQDLLKLNEDRENFMAENFAKLCEKFNGGVIFIFGAGHYDILRKLSRFYQDTTSKFHIISFLMLSSKQFTGSFKKLQSMQGNSLETLNALSNIEVHTLFLDNLHQNEIDQFFANKLQIPTPMKEKASEVSYSTKPGTSNFGASLLTNTNIEQAKQEPKENHDSKFKDRLKR